MPLHIFQGRGRDPVTGEKLSPVDITPVVTPEGHITTWEEGPKYERWTDAQGNTIPAPKPKRGRGGKRK